MSAKRRLDPFDRWMIRSNLRAIEEGASAVELVANLRAQGYELVAEWVEAECARLAEIASGARCYRCAIRSAELDPAERPRRLASGEWSECGGCEL